MHQKACEIYFSRVGISIFGGIKKNEHKKWSISKTRDQFKNRKGIENEILSFSGI